VPLPRSRVDRPACRRIDRARGRRRRDRVIDQARVCGRERSENDRAPAARRHADRRRAVRRAARDGRPGDWHVRRVPRPFGVAQIASARALMRRRTHIILIVVAVLVAWRLGVRSYIRGAAFVVQAAGIEGAARTATGWYATAVRVADVAPVPWRGGDLPARA